MTAVFHPEFPHDIHKFEAEYARISVGLGNRFRSEVDDAGKNSGTSTYSLDRFNMIYRIY